MQQELPGLSPNSDSNVSTDSDDFKSIAIRRNIAELLKGLAYRAGTSQVDLITNLIIALNQLTNEDVEVLLNLGRMIESARRIQELLPEHHILTDELVRYTVISVSTLQSLILRANNNKG